MQRRVLAVLSALVVSGCASTVWEKPGANQQDFASDSYGCERDMRQSGYYGGGIVGALTARDFQARCMVAHGWRESGEPAPVNYLPVNTRSPVGVQDAPPAPPAPAPRAMAAPAQQPARRFGRTCTHEQAVQLRIAIANGYTSGPLCDL